VRIAIPAVGTRGDVFPYVVLGRGLRTAGHDVLISTMSRFRSLVEDSGLRFHGIPGDPSELFDAVTLDVSPRRPIKHLNVIRRALSTLVAQVQIDELMPAWRDAELVIFSPSTTFGHFAAQQLAARSVMLTLTPAVPTSEFAHPVLAPGLRLGRYGNRASWLVGERLQRQTFTEPLRPAVRRAWGLAPFPLQASRLGARWPPFPVIHAYSPEVVPGPRDWPAQVEVSGWLLPERSNAPLPDAVERFLRDGSPPLYIGFGSMPVTASGRIDEIVAAALARSRSRAIVSGMGLASTSALHRAESVLVVQELPHERLFERVRGIVHHGGSGTVGASLRAGKPTLIVPFVFDQFFWGRRVQRLGAGPPPIPVTRLSVDRLAGALVALASEPLREAALRLGERVSAENGVARAVAAIERLCA